MFFVKSEYPINEKVDDILVWLENDMQIIESFEDEGSRVTFHSKRNGNTIEVFHMMWISGEKSALPGSLSFSFDVKKVTDTKSLIIGKYQDENIHIKKLYYTYLARLGGVFSANFKESATKRLAEIKAEIEKESGVHWGWTEWRVDKRTGLRTRAYGLIPNDPEPAQSVDTAMNEFVFVLNTTRDDFTDWFYEKANWNPDPDIKQKIKKASQHFGVESRLSKINAKKYDISPRDKNTLRLLFGDESHYPGAELYFYLLPVDDNRLEVTASFTGDNGFAVFAEALRTIAQTYHEAKSVITRYLDNELPIDAEQAIEPSKPEKPQAPKRGSSMVVWFDYYHEMKKAKYKISFTDLASLSGYSANTFKQEHGRYKSERGID